MDNQERVADVFVYFDGSAEAGGMPGGPQDEKAREIFEAHGGLSIGAGTFFGPDGPDRDVQYRFPVVKVDAVEAALKAAGFRTEVKNRQTMQ